MSIISNNKEAKKEARRAYVEKLVEMRTAEHNAMNEMLDILRNADGLMTAAQISAACTNDISSHEVASNLIAMKTHHSRYGYRVCRHRNISIPRVNIPDENWRGEGEHIIVRGGGNRRTTIVEVDENGNIIPNTKRPMTIRESCRYGIG